MEMKDFEQKSVHMTDQYAAEYLLRQGYLAARIEMMMTKTLTGMVKDGD